MKPGGRAGQPEGGPVASFSSVRPYHECGERDRTSLLVRQGHIALSIHANASRFLQMHYKKAPRSDDAIPFLRNSRRAVLAVKVRFARAFRATLTAVVRSAPSAPLGRNAVLWNSDAYGSRWLGLL